MSGNSAAITFLRREFVENDDTVDAFKTGENLGAFLFRNQRPVRAFQCAHAGVAVYAHDQQIAKVSSGFQAVNVAGMQQSRSSRW